MKIANGLIAVFIVFLVVVGMWLSRSRGEHNQGPNTDTGQQDGKRSNELSCTLRCKAGANQQLQFGFELQNTARTNLLVRTIVRGLNVKCFCRQRDGPKFFDASDRTQSGWRPMQPIGSFLAPAITNLVSGHALKYEFEITLDPGEYECYATYSISEEDTNATWHGEVRSEHANCVVR
jgi:hypothetical protein